MLLARRTRSILRSREMNLFLRRGLGFTVANGIACQADLPVTGCPGYQAKHEMQSVINVIMQAGGLQSAVILSR